MDQMDQMDQMFIHNKDFHLEIWNIFSPSKQLLPDYQNSQIKTLIRGVKCFQHTTNFHSYDPIPLLTFTPTVTILFIYLYLPLDLKITDFQLNVMPVSQDHSYSIHETQDRPTKPYYNNSHHL